MRDNRITPTRLTAALLPAALALTLAPSAAVTAQAQSSDLSSLSSNRGISDGLRPSDPPKRTPIEVEKNPEIPGLPEGVKVDRIEWITSRRVAVFIKSAAMPKELIQVQILLARDWHSNPTAKFPEVWALDGLRARDDENGWTIETNIEQFYADKNVNVILPVGGESSFYSDWQRENNGKHYKWETFLTKELPGPIEKQLGADSRRAIVGFSMSGTSALVLPTKIPGFYDAAASFSGCAATSTWAPYNFARLTVNRGAGAAGANYQNVTPEQMWGPMGGDYNRWNDALVNADKLRGTALYVSTATGLASENDMMGTLIGKGATQAEASAAAMTLQIEGGVIEAAINSCNHDLRAKLENLQIPAHYEFRNVGTHSWPDWRKDLENSWWKTIKPAFKM